MLVYIFAVISDLNKQLGNTVYSTIGVWNEYSNPPFTYMYTTDIAY